MGAQLPFLWVNALGKRYMNEDNAFEHFVNQECSQPGQFRWQVFDAKYDEDRKNFYSVANGVTLLPDGMVTVVEHGEPLVEPAEAAGVLVKADSIEELAKAMEVPVDAFVASVKRYNELVAGGEDLDYGKNSDFLTTIEKGPFYAIKRMPLILCTVAGLDINNSLQVMDTEGEVIPGLYAAGNASGNFYSGDYPMILNSVANGRAVTFGMLAGQYAAEENV